MLPDDRIRLVHMIEAAEAAIGHDILWVTVTREIPDLLPKLRALIEKE